MKPVHKTCGMCGNVYFHYSDAPCRVYFMDKYVELCYSCGARIIQFIKSYRQKKSWSRYVM